VLTEFEAGYAHSISDPRSNASTVSAEDRRVICCETVNLVNAVAVAYRELGVSDRGGYYERVRKEPVQRAIIVLWESGIS
jgi:hypothetical protein